MSAISTIRVNFYAPAEFELGVGVVKRTERAGSDEPLVRINFAPEAISYLDGRHVEVAKSMMDAGLQKAFDVGEEPVPQVEGTETKQHTLH